MPDRIHLIAHHAAELAVLLRVFQEARASVFSIREQDHALLFEIDPVQAGVVHRRWREGLQGQTSQQGQQGQQDLDSSGMLQRWLMAAQARVDAPSEPAQALVQSFRGQDCRSMSFVQQDLRGADFSDADLRGVDFSGANLQGARFQRAQLGLRQDGSGWANWLANCYRTLGSWGWHYLQRNLTNLGSRFRGCDLRQADFSGAHIGMVNFHGADLANCNWRGASWRGPVWVSDARLQQPALLALLCQGSREVLDFSHQDFSRLDLSWLDLSGFDLRNCCFDDANLSHARLSGADIRMLRRTSTTRWDAIDCDHWRWPGLEDGRWPPLPENLQTGDAARWLQIEESGITFLAHNWAELLAWLEVLPELGLRLQQIRFDEAASSLGPGACFRISVPAAAADAGKLCKLAWQRKMALASIPDKIPDNPQLLALFAALMPDPASN